MIRRWVQPLAGMGAAACMLACGQLAGLHDKSCQACASSTARLVCSDNGTVAAEDCGADSYCAEGTCFSNDIEAIAASPTHVCATKANGSIWCWGPPVSFPELYKDLWQLTPTQVALPPGKRAILSSVGLSAGLVHTCAILVDDDAATGTSGSVYCWGGNLVGQLGTSNSGEASQGPTAPVPNLPAVSAITSGFGHTCAISAERGQAFCWGANYLGQSAQEQDSRCEDLATLQLNDPLENVPGGIALPGQPLAFGPAPETPVQEIIAKGHHTCALVNSALYCWGSNCGHGHPEDILGNRCADSGGHSYGGQLQLDPSAKCYQWSPRLMKFPSDSGVVAVKQFAVGFAATYAAKWANEGDPAPVYAWGADDQGQLGTGSTDTAVWTPAPVQLTLGDGTSQALVDATDLIPSAGSDMCAVRGSSLVCAGISDCGELGWGSYLGTSSTMRATNLPIPHAPRRGSHYLIARGDDFGCAALPGTTNVSCWGREGFLGDGQTASPATPCSSPGRFQPDPVPIQLGAR